MTRITPERKRIDGIPLPDGSVAQAAAGGFLSAFVRARNSGRVA